MSRSYIEILENLNDTIIEAQKNIRNCGQDEFEDIKIRNIISTSFHMGALQVAISRMLDDLD